MGCFFEHSVAITGGFASGKSTVAKALAKIMDYAFFDADQEVAVLIKKGGPGWTALRNFLGDDFFLKDAQINKPHLRKAIFTDNGLRKKVEKALHPMVREALRDKALSAFVEHGKKSLIEVPLLYEVNWQADFSAVIVVTVSEQTAIKRAIERDGLTDRQARQAIAAQIPLKEKVAQADYVIENGKGWKDTMDQLLELKKNLDTRNCTS